MLYVGSIVNMAGFTFVFISNVIVMQTMEVRKCSLIHMLFCVIDILIISYVLSCKFILV